MRDTSCGHILICILTILPVAEVLAAQQTGDSGAKSAVPVQASADPAQFVKQPKVAVVVGESDYDLAAGFHPLRFAGKDAEELAEVLRDDGYTIVGDCPPDKPQPAKGGGCALTGPLANYSKVKLALQQATRIVSDGNGTLLFYFSGHGEQKSETGPQYMVLYGGDEQDLDRASFKVDELKKIIKDTAARKILLIDACRSGEEEVTPEKKAKAEESQVFRDLVAATGTRIMNSTKYPYSSWEDKKLGHGRFSYYLLKGLKGEAAETNGLITFDGLFRYVNHGVDEEAAKNPGQPQQVHEDGDHRNDFYVAGNLKLESIPAAGTVNKSRPRRALLIGNNAYLKSSALAGAVNDASAMEKVLKNFSFASELLKNVPSAEMEADINKFAQSVQPGDDVLFYFAGRGVLANGQPFLTPVDYGETGATPSSAAVEHRGLIVVNGAVTRSEAEAERLFGYPIKKLLNLLALKADVRKMLIFDICLAPPDGEKPRFTIPPIVDGLTAMLFATFPGGNSYEVNTEDGPHGVFTNAILTALKANSGLRWPELTAQVWDLTRKAGDDRNGFIQTPFSFGFLGSEFRFAPQ